MCNRVVFNLLPGVEYVTLAVVAVAASAVDWAVTGLDRRCHWDRHSGSNRIADLSWSRQPAGSMGR